MNKLFIWFTAVTVSFLSGCNKQMDVTPQEKTESSNFFNLQKFLSENVATEKLPPQIPTGVIYRCDSILFDKKKITLPSTFSGLLLLNEEISIDQFQKNGFGRSIYIGENVLPCPYDIEKDISIDLYIKSGVHEFEWRNCLVKLSENISNPSMNWGADPKRIEIIAVPLIKKN